MLREIDHFCDLSLLGEIEVRTSVQKSTDRGNWKLQAENVVDGYHVAFVNQSFFDLHKVRHPGESNPVNSLVNATSYDLGNGHTKLLPVSILSGLRDAPGSPTTCVLWRQPTARSRPRIWWPQVRRTC